MGVILSQFFQIHPENPQQRLIKQAVDIIHKSGVVIFPTDCAYVIGCHMGDKSAMDRIRAIRRLDKHHNFTLMCRDLSEISTYAQINNQQYRFLKNYTPGAYTFILKATREVPRRILQEKRKTIGIRIPDNLIALELLAQLGEPIMSSSLILPNEKEPQTDPYEIRRTLEHCVDLVIDGGFCGFDASTVIDLVDEEPLLVRQGLGSTEDMF